MPDTLATLDVGTLPRVGGGDQRSGTLHPLLSYFRARIY